MAYLLFNSLAEQSHKPSSHHRPQPLHEGKQEQREQRRGHPDAQVHRRVRLELADGLGQELPFSLQVLLDLLKIVALSSQDSALLPQRRQRLVELLHRRLEVINRLAVLPVNLIELVEAQGLPPRLLVVIALEVNDPFRDLRLAQARALDGTLDKLFHTLGWHHSPPAAPA